MDLERHRSLFRLCSVSMRATVPAPDYMNTISKVTQWERPTQRVHSTGGRDGRPQVVDTPMAHARRGSNASSVHSHHSSSSGAAPVHRSSAAAAVSAAASSPPDSDAPPPPLGSTPAAPSYRTAVLLSNSSAAAAAAVASAGGAHLQRDHEQEMRPAPAETPAAGVGEGREKMRLPPNWHMRTTAENRPCELGRVWRWCARGYGGENTEAVWLDVQLNGDSCSFERVLISQEVCVRCL